MLQHVPYNFCSAINGQTSHVTMLDLWRLTRGVEGPCIRGPPKALEVHGLHGDNIDILHLHHHFFIPPKRFRKNEQLLDHLILF